jgi:hypothetical protein
LLLQPHPGRTQDVFETSRRRSVGSCLRDRRGGRRLRGLPQHLGRRRAGSGLVCSDHSHTRFGARSGDRGCGFASAGAPRASPGGPRAGRKGHSRAGPGDSSRRADGRGDTGPLQAGCSGDGRDPASCSDAGADPSS